jgi:hypothetical protein
LKTIWIWFRSHVKDFVQPRLRKLVCSLLGHLPVARIGLWYMQRQFLSDDVKAMCIRCSKRFRFQKELEDNLFVGLSFYKSLKSHRGEGRN